MQPNGIDTISRLTNITSRLSSMDNAGISYVVVSIGAPGIQGIPNATQAVQLAQEINDEIYTTYVKSHPSRFGFWASVAMQNATAAALELERSVKHLGAKGAMIHGYTEVLNPTTNEIEIQYLDEPRCMPLWAKVAELNVPIYLHPRSPPLNQQLMFNDASNTRTKYPGLVTAGWGFTAEAAVHSLRLMLSGLFDTYPSIQIILGHAAEGLPFLVHRIDTQLAADTSHHNTAGVPTYNKSLRSYLRNNFHATLSGVRRLSTLRCTLDEMGEERVMFSVDYPFQSDQDAGDWFDYVEGVGVEAKKKIAWGNARRLLRIVEVGEGWVEEEELL